MTHLISNKVDLNDADKENMNKAKTGVKSLLKMTKARFVFYTEIRLRADTSLGQKVDLT